MAVERPGQAWTETPARIAVLDIGSSNATSVQSALEKVGAQAFRTDDPEAVLAADGLVLPGQGNFPVAVGRLRERGLIGPLNRFKRSGRPILGICLGMQLMFEASSEACSAGELTRGLGWLAGDVGRLSSVKRSINNGWCFVDWAKPAGINAGLAETEAFYHLHSYACRPEDQAVVAARTEIEVTFVSAIQHENLYATQFHPENSAPYPGLALMRNFVEIALKGSETV